MKIGINLIQYTDITGVEVFAKNLLASLIKQGGINEFVLFVNPKSNEIFDFKADNIKVIVKNFKKISRARLIFYQQFEFLWRLKREKIDILYCPSVAAPILYNKKIITIHDCAALRFSDEATFISRLFLRLIFLSAKFLSLGVVTVSEFAKKEIIDLLKISTDKITVISEGAPLLPSISEEEAGNAIIKLGLLDRRFFFYISNLRPRKNVSRLLEAWREFSSINKNYYLVIAGKINTSIANIDNVLFTGFISDIEKVALYKKSLAFIFPSIYEGFGLPILEAQQLGAPVLSSKTSSLPEVAGDGAVFFDPYDIKEISSILSKFIKDDFAKDGLIQNGYENIKRFSWEKSAGILIGLINSLKRKIA